MLMEKIVVITVNCNIIILVLESVTAISETIVIVISLDKELWLCYL